MISGLIRLGNKIFIFLLWYLFCFPSQNSISVFGVLIYSSLSFSSVYLTLRWCLFIMYYPGQKDFTRCFRWIFLFSLSSDPPFPATPLCLLFWYFWGLDGYVFQFHYLYPLLYWDFCYHTLSFFFTDFLPIFLFFGSIMILISTYFSYANLFLISVLFLSLWQCHLYMWYMYHVFKVTVFVDIYGVSI